MKLSYACSTYIYSENERTGVTKDEAEMTGIERERERENAGDAVADPKGALTSNQANIFDSLMKTAVRTRVTGRTKTRRWLLTRFIAHESFVKQSISCKQNSIDCIRESET